MPPPKVNLTSAFQGFSDTWSPKIAGDINSMQLKLVKLEGAFHWHHHDAEDELFLVHKGIMRMCFRDGERLLEAGEFIVVPRGVEHMPVAETEVCEVILVEPSSTLNTGNVETDRTVRDLDRVE